jgi:hypothetical protein
MESRPDLFRREVQMVGYMFTSEASGKRKHREVPAGA